MVSGKKMIVVFEFFDKETIENIISALYYNVDKVVYFGNEKVMTEGAKKITKKCLNELCDVTDIEFVLVSESSFEKAVNNMTEAVIREMARGSECFFDLTGGSEVSLAAMGQLTQGLTTPMHRFNVKTGKLEHVSNDGGRPLDMATTRRTPALTVDEVLMLKGARILYDENQLSDQVLNDSVFKDSIYKLWSIAKKNTLRWNGCVSILGKIISENHFGQVYYERDYNSIIGSMKVPDVNGISDFISFLTEIQSHGALSDVRTYTTGNGEKGFSFLLGNTNLKDPISKAGQLLELYTYYELIDTKKYSDVKVSIAIDWDENTPEDKSEDVKNEIDVVCVDNNLPVFVSCKNTKKLTKEHLYELEAVANRCGGKYATKKIATVVDAAGEVYNRAADMNIYLSNQIEGRACNKM